MQYPAHDQPIDRGAEAIWKAILRIAEKGELFRLEDVMREVGASRNTLRDWLKRLQRGGYIHDIGRLPDKSVVWRLPKTFADEVPRLKRDGTPTKPQYHAENGNARMWRAMKMLKRFTTRELALAASLPSKPVKFNAAQSYLVNIHRAGYVRQEGKDSWRLIKDTGGKALQIQRGKHVYDPNTGERYLYNNRETARADSVRRTQPEVSLESAPGWPQGGGAV